MKKYLGSRITAFCAIVAPLFVIGPIVFAVIALTSASDDPAAIFVAIGCFACAIVWGLYLKQIAIQLYSWGKFEKDGVLVRTLFAKKHYILYEKCNDIGIGSYVHGLLNSRMGSKIHFIYLSYDYVPVTHKNAINLWKPSKTGIKIQFSQTLYAHLLTVLPAKKARGLRQDHGRMHQK